MLSSHLWGQRGSRSSAWLCGCPHHPHQLLACRDIPYGKTQVRCANLSSCFSINRFIVRVIRGVMSRLPLSRRQIIERDVYPNTFASPSCESPSLYRMALNSCGVRVCFMVRYAFLDFIINGGDLLRQNII